MKTVYLKVDEEYVDGAGKVAGAKGSSGSTDILVEFSPDWEALSKYATTRDAKGLHPEVIVLTELMKEPIGEEEEERYAYRFSLTANAMSEEGHMSITFTGYEIEDGNETETIINTAIAKLRVLPSDYSEMDDGSVTPTIAQQLQSEMRLAIFLLFLPKRIKTVYPCPFPLWRIGFAPRPQIGRELIPVTRHAQREHEIRFAFRFSVLRTIPAEEPDAERPRQIRQELRPDLKSNRLACAKRELVGVTPELEQFVGIPGFMILQIQK